MEVSIVYPPNRPLERAMKQSQIPVLHDFLFFIEANLNGEIILGSSNVASTYWQGTIFHYKDYSFTKDNEYNSYFTSNSTITDAKFILDQCMLLAEDSGNLKLLSLPKDERQSMECRYNYDKDDRIVELTVWNNTKIASCTETYINLYDITHGSSIQSNTIFKSYHTDTILSIDANKSDENLFVSASADRKACVWDIRMDVPATVIYNNEFSSLTSIAWSPLNRDCMVVGSEAGDIYLLDIKQPTDVLCSTHCFDGSIYKRGNLNLFYKTSSGSNETKELNFLKMKVVKGDLTTPSVFSKAKGIKKERKQAILQNLSTLIPDNRRQFWQSLPVNDAATDLTSQYDDI
ncbi:methylosome protein 50 [Holotrichia oblita]|uniref:Methylosome protein 50 n=1 Tax=Holotrichia oblita TaxID=644536 RepID=A0ACB9TUT1_HOLOL|nr:methylosome protein 50 [Holotrichia oblita]